MNNLNNKKEYLNIKNMTMLAAVVAIAYISTMLTSPIKVFEFLSFDIKDAIIVITGFIFEPISALLVTIVVSLLEAVTFSQTGLIGLIMNIISTSFFVLPAAIIYKYKKSLASAISGLIIGTIVMTIIMLLWNYIVAPLYMGIPRPAIVAMLPTVFLPFNILKGCINSTIVLLLYKPIVTALRKAKLINTQTDSKPINKNKAVIVSIVSGFLLITFILIMIAYN